ncbi:hypothetical protein EON62_05825, partial [archaeon]
MTMPDAVCTAVSVCSESTDVPLNYFTELSGTVSVEYGSNVMTTTDDLSTQLFRNDVILIDGEPYRVSSMAIDTSEERVKSSLDEYWKVFDELDGDEGGGSNGGAGNADAPDAIAAPTPLTAGVPTSLSTVGGSVVLVDGTKRKQPGPSTFAHFPLRALCAGRCASGCFPAREPACAQPPWNGYTWPRPCKKQYL